MGGPVTFHLHVFIKDYLSAWRPLDQSIAGAVLSQVAARPIYSLVKNVFSYLI